MESYLLEQGMEVDVAASCEPLSLNLSGESTSGVVNAYSHITEKCIQILDYPRLCGPLFPTIDPTFTPTSNPSKLLFDCNVFLLSNTMLSIRNER